MISRLRGGGSERKSERKRERRERSPVGSVETAWEVQLAGEASGEGCMGWDGMGWDGATTELPKTFYSWMVMTMMMTCHCKYAAIWKVLSGDGVKLAHPWHI
jgi:hypothetical protein